MGGREGLDQTRYEVKKKEKKGRFQWVALDSNFLESGIQGFTAGNSSVGSLMPA